ncbi:right-handed parallel beta-helix repeat-containing protein [uncultured Porphyromonas sp.]|uniref:right-handed parallel beta-helix repeat-containing protein n=1 Tax=uncultured Porphyromonas sp. TaxID=159274 RepID=UPI002805C886|nr:right-handed parallel beta-helix repeat-containing protein [uncultured Porphyromonas sp.]
MKQKLLHQSLIVTLVTMLLALAGSSASAQTPYNFSIAGVEVTSANCSDLSNIPGVTGKVTYDPETKTLTLDNATINGGDEAGIYSSAFINCVVKGDVNVTSDKGDALFFYNEATISGGGKLTASSNDGAGIGVMGELTIEDCSVVASGKQGFCARDAYLNESLIINNAFVTAKGTEGSIYGLTNFTLEGCEITKPAGAVWNASKHAVCDASGNVITSEVVITPPVVGYDLWIASAQVTSANCSDLSVIDGVTGKATYDPTTKTLTLEDATIDGGNDNGMEIYDELTCVVKGEVSITSNNRTAMEFYNRNAIIKGNGQLTTKSSEKCGIFTGAALLIEGCTVYAEGKWGISGNTGTSGESLTIRNATVTAKGTTYGSICNFANFKLEGCEITKPAGAAWNASKHAVCDASGKVSYDEVVITPVEEYGLQIAGVKVNSANCSDLSVIDGVKGKVSYDPATKTLTLEDASIDVGEGRHGVWSKDQLTCVVKGEVSITSNNECAMGFYNNAIIKGNGQLTLKSSKAFGIYTGAALLIDGCTVRAEGVWGILGPEIKDSSLTIKNATVTAKGTDGSIGFFTNFTLEGCEITKPAGAVWNASKRAVCDASGNVITDEVVISPKGGTAIDFVTPEQRPAEGAIYDMNGVLRSEPLEELPTGVYIVGGHKVMHVQR